MVEDSQHPCKRGESHHDEYVSSVRDTTLQKTVMVMMMMVVMMRRRIIPHRVVLRTQKFS